MSNSYRDLLVWQSAMDLADLIYDISSGFPKDETFGLRSQLRRAGVSIPSNIAEGQSRNTVGEFRHFLGNAKGSLSEVETQLELSRRRQFISEDQFNAAIVGCGKTSRLLNGLIKSLDDAIASGRSLNRPLDTRHKTPDTKIRAAKAGK